MFDLPNRDWQFSVTHQCSMEATDLVPMIEQLDDNIDDLEEALEPLMKATLSDMAAKLPLLDKAQLYVLVTYAIESILFCLYNLLYHVWSR